MDNKYKYVYYTDGTKNLRLKDFEIPPEGFKRGRVVAKPKDAEGAKQKRMQTCLERYGNATYNNLDKRKKTCIDRFGVDNPNKCAAVQEKIKKTCIEKYGVDNPSKNDEIKKKILDRQIEKYGKLINFSNKDTLALAVKNSTTEQAKQQRMNTCIEKYGVPYAGILFGLPDARDTKPNLEFKELLIENNLFDDCGVEYSLNNYRYDFRVGNTLVEINPTITHNSTISIYKSRQPKDKKYHSEKTNNAISNGYNCIHIWDWDDKNKILRMLKNDSETIYARNCSVEIITDKTVVDTFLRDNHLQGKLKFDICIGLTYNNTIVSIMTFGKPRYNKNYEYELLRYCSTHRIVGGAKKIFSHFIKLYNPNSVISYCDLSKFSGAVYEKLGFKLIRTTIGKHWYNIRTQQHITDNLLRQRGFDQLFKANYGKGTSNAELMKQHNFLEVFDAGQATYVWDKAVHLAVHSVI